MGYPQGAGPEAGRFGAGPWSPTADGGSRNRAPIPLPIIRTERGVQTEFLPTYDYVATLGAPPSGYNWLIQRLTVSASGAAPAWLYIGGDSPEYLVAGTPSGQMDTFDAVNLIPVRSGEVVTVKWRYDINVHVGSAVARMEYWEVPA